MNAVTTSAQATVAADAKAQAEFFGWDIEETVAEALASHAHNEAGEVRAAARSLELAKHWAGVFASDDAVAQECATNCQIEAVVAQHGREVVLASLNAFIAGDAAGKSTPYAFC